MRHHLPAHLGIALFAVLIADPATAQEPDRPALPRVQEPGPIESRIAEASARLTAGDEKAADAACARLQRARADLDAYVVQARLRDKLRREIDRLLGKADPLSSTRRKAYASAARRLVSTSDAYQRRGEYGPALELLLRAEALDERITAYPLKKLRKQAPAELWGTTRKQRELTGRTAIDRKLAPC